MKLNIILIFLLSVLLLTSCVSDLDSTQTVVQDSSINQSPFEIDTSRVIFDLPSVGQGIDVNFSPTEKFILLRYKTDSMGITYIANKKDTTTWIVLPADIPEVGGGYITLHEVKYLDQLYQRFSKKEDFYIVLADGVEYFCRKSSQTERLVTIFTILNEHEDVENFGIEFQMESKNSETPPFPFALAFKKVASPKNVGQYVSMTIGELMSYGVLKGPASVEKVYLVEKKCFLEIDPVQTLEIQKSLIQKMAEAQIDSTEQL